MKITDLHNDRNVKFANNPITVAGIRLGNSCKISNNPPKRGPFVPPVVFAAEGVFIFRFEMSRSRDQFFLEYVFRDRKQGKRRSLPR